MRASRPAAGAVVGAAVVGRGVGGAALGAALVGGAAVGAGVGSGGGPAQAASSSARNRYVKAERNMRILWPGGAVYSVTRFSF